MRQVQLIVLQALQHVVVVIGAHDDGHAIVVLGGGPNHRRPADVDILDGIVDRGVVSRDGLLERIEVDDQQVDRFDAVFQHHVLVNAATAEKPAVYDGVQRFHTPVHNLREAGFLTNFNDFEARLA